MQTNTRYIGGKRFETSLGRHFITTDQPLSGGGADAGPTPPELLLAALGTCAGHYAAEYLQARSLCLDNLRISVSADKAGPPARLASFRIEVEAPGINDRHRDGVMRAVKACLIHSTLTNRPALEIVVNGAAAPEHEPANAA